MNILFTRPLIDNENSLNELFLKGYNIMHLPTLKITPTNIKPIDTKNYDCLIFTSSNAVRFLKLKKDNKEVKCFCVGNMTEKILRSKGFSNTIAASGSVNSLKNLILNSIEKKNNSKPLLYLCGDVISFDLDIELEKEGFRIKKIVNYKSTKITDLNIANAELLKKYPPNAIFIYSKRSAESFNQIIKKYSLAQLMTHSKVMCISKKIKDFLNSCGWTKTDIFTPGEELIKIEKI